MAPSKPLLCLLSALALASGASASCKECVLNSCARAVRYATTGPDHASRQADCSAFLAVTVTPAAETTWETTYLTPVTVTVTTEPPAWTPTLTSPVEKRVVTQTASLSDSPDNTPTNTIPAYASSRCADAAQYSNACSCWKISASTATASVAAVTSTSTVASTVTYYDYESPPLASSSVSFPAGNSWTSTYTYAEYTLPVFTSAPDPSVVVDYPTPSETCLMDTVPTGDSFYLLAPGAGYIVKRGASLGPVEEPADEAAAEALLSNWNPPTFEFQTAENAPDGLFDLVVRDGVSPDLYVAFDISTGDISLVSSSTNGIEQDGKATTVFGVSCRGSLLLQYGSTTYVWTSTDTSTIAAPGTPATGESDTLNTMLLLPARIRTPLNQPATTQTKRRRSQPGTTPWKRDFSQYGVAQRCPDFPNKMVATSNGRSGSAPNGCGPDGAWYSMIVPNLSFGGCCNTHDRCYDSCPDYFEKCNSDFLGCMINSCNDKYDHWYSSWLLPGCYAAADLYFIAVSGKTAQEHFQSGSKQLCDCKCADSDFAICTAGSKTCQRVRGVGNNDSKNCGGCGQDCGSRAHCENAQCLCNPVAPTPNQCGNMCLDFQTHPRHCGNCNTVCPSGYCYKGACFTPPDDTDQCYPVNAITNGDFLSGLTGWTITGTDYPFTYNVGVGQNMFKRALYMSPSQNGAVTGGFMESPYDVLTATTTLRLCPGTAYKLDFQAWNPSSFTTLIVNVGNTALTGEFDIMSAVNVWSAQGPFDLPVFNTGDAGTTTAADGSLRVSLSIGFFIGRASSYVLKLTDVAVYSTG